MEENHNKPDTK